jgi:hypothetical protein
MVCRQYRVGEKRIHGETEVEGLLLLLLKFCCCCFQTSQPVRKNVNFDLVSQVPVKFFLRYRIQVFLALQKTNPKLGLVTYASNPSN